MNAVDPRTRLLLEAPIGRTLLRLVWFGGVGWPCRTDTLLRRIKPAQTLNLS